MKNQTTSFATVTAALALVSFVVMGQRAVARATADPISPIKAMKIAEGSAGGKAGMAIYEFDDGKWIYSVPVAKAGKLSEVEIDPTTGKVLETEAVDAKAEAKEFAAALNKLAKAHS